MFTLCVCEHAFLFHLLLGPTAVQTRALLEPEVLMETKSRFKEKSNDLFGYELGYEINWVIK